MNKCIFCDSIENLTSSIQITTKLGAKTVHICQSHEETASPKLVREAVEQRESTIVELERKAAEIGYTLVPISKIVTQESIKTATMPEQEQRQAKPQAVPVKTLRKVNVRPVNVPIVAKGANGDVNLDSHQPYDISDDAPGIIEHEEQTISGRAGTPTAIPKKIVSEAGTTEINVVNTGGDKALQERFKALAHGSQSNVKSPDFRSGYAIRECAVCRGTGTTKIGNKTCPKCNGSGIMS